MAGDVRTNSQSSTITVFGTTFGGNSDQSDGREIQLEKIRPYTRKRERSIMSTIDELGLVVKARTSAAAGNHRCDVRHDVPGLFFSTGGYNGNLFHEFTDAIVPLFITARRFNGRVIFVILEYHRWWVTKYNEILSALSDHQVIDFRRDNRTHCFPGAVVGLRAHDDLQIDLNLTEDNTTIQDFRDFLDRAYSTRIREIIEEEEESDLAGEESKKPRNPKLVVMARNDSRMILNQIDLVRLAGEIGFRVEVLVPDRRTELARMYKILNSSDAMVGVHGAALTHFMFLRPGSVFIQIVPVGIDWAAENYCEKPAVKMGLEYIGYKIGANESTLHRQYDESDVVFTNPLSVNRKGWNYTKSIYLDHQNVVLDLARFRPSLVRAHRYLSHRMLNGS
ncbi:unnamed protein product [Cuscuta campestris]|uniref:Glycosyltransferase 61 catalytic domain-containing protein n=1 Tax=Cuscuta campestris TaxID=132261 RepID=A0A484LQG6_9ASTE|nr:unnamed protein product [Cuscuta campestris]